MTSVEFMELELTDSCDLECVHCYNESGPLVAHGPMTVADWTSAIDQGLELGLQRLQLIGGEPTRFPGWIEVLDHAVTAGLSVSVFSNLTHIRDAWWPPLTRPGVTLCTSYYSDVAEQHDRVTTRAGSHANTRANMVAAIGRGIQVRAAITKVFDGQRVEQARADLETLGVEDVRIDGVRKVGRGGWTCDVRELCGNCGRERMAILPDGIVVPCVLGRWLKAGNVRVTPLAEILSSAVWHKAVASVPRPPKPLCLPQAEQMQKAREEKTHAYL
jgi:MoaA/NifB/PqqE/SkfB family radical SAM enzyme